MVHNINDLLPTQIRMHYPEFLLIITGHYIVTDGNQSISEMLNDVLSLIDNISEIPDIVDLELDQIQEDTIHT